MEIYDRTLYNLSRVSFKGGGMKQFLRSIGFSMYKKKGEIKELLDQIQSEHIAAARIVITPEKERYWEIRFMVNQILGLCLFGNLDNISHFNREGYFPYIQSNLISSSSNVSLQMNLDDTTFSGLVDDNRVGISLIFRINNNLEILDAMGESRVPKAITLGAFSTEGKVLLPIQKTEEQILRINSLNNTRSQLIEAAKNGDESAMDSLSTEDMLLYSTISRRMTKDDMYSIIDNLFMPFGMESDMYTIIGEILDFSFLKNQFTQEESVLLQIKCNDILLLVAMARGDLQGEPQIGRRFKGNIWMQGTIHFS